MSEDLLIDDAVASPEGESVEVFPEVTWHWEDVLAGVLPIFIFRLAVALYPEKIAPLAIPLTFVTTVWMWFFPLVVARSRGAKFRFPSLETTAIEGVIAIPTLMIIWFGLGIVMGITLLLVPQMDQNTNPFIERAVGNFANPFLWLLFLTACTAAPLGEELFFRAMLYRFLRQHIDIPSAILIQGLLFGFAHTYGILHAILASFLGISFAIAFEWRKTLVTPIALHMMQNTVAMIATVGMAIILSFGPFLGVWGEASEQGCEITRVDPEGSAAEAGIKVGDIIVKFGAEPITDFASLKKAIHSHRVGEEIAVRFFRDDKMQQVQVQLKSRQQSSKD